MVIMKRFLPDDPALSILQRLRSPLVISRPVNRTGGLSLLILGAPGLPDACLRVVDHSVAFKFEVFEFRIASWTSRADHLEFGEMGRISSWDLVKCLFRFEWQRAAVPGEVPAGYEQVIGDRGRQEKIPAAANDVVVAMVGIGFFRENSALPVAALLNSDDDPVTLRLLSSTSDLEQALLDCEVLEAKDVHRWAAQLEDP